MEDGNLQRSSSEEESVRGGVICVQDLATLKYY